MRCAVRRPRLALVACVGVVPLEAIPGVLHSIPNEQGLKRLDYENVEEDLTNKSELLLASNPVHKKIPVLLHGGKPVPESILIVQYLDDAFPGAGQAILPADPYDRAVARFWAAYVDDKIVSSIRAALTATTDEGTTAGTANMLAALETLEGAFAELSGGKGFFAGDAPGYVDVALGGFVAWLRAWDKLFGVDQLLDAGRIPLLAAWAQRFAALDAAKEVLPDVDQLVQFAQAVLRARRGCSCRPCSLQQMRGNRRMLLTLLSFGFLYCHRYVVVVIWCK
ncbi:hypothetical protein EJB05_15910, partial [Eragrostis curvula]